MLCELSVSRGNGVGAMLSVETRDSAAVLVLSREIDSRHVLQTTATAGIRVPIAEARHVPLCRVGEERRAGRGPRLSSHSLLRAERQQQQQHTSIFA